MRHRTTAVPGSAVRAPRQAPALARLALGFTFIALGACREDAGEAARVASALAADATAQSVVKAPATAYRERGDVVGGAIRVLAIVTGDERPAPPARPAPELQRACGTEVEDGSLVRDGDRLADVVVWLPDVREGKPLPVERRFELTSEQCRLAPRVQVVLAGGTLNLRTLDEAEHRLRLQRPGEAAREVAITEPIAVVPDEKVLEKPGQVEVTCALHGWSHAWLFVLDHPYAAVTAREGMARLDAVPPGRHRVLAWHERFGLREDTVDVVAGGEVEVRFELAR